MRAISGYILLEELHEGRSTTTLRAVRESDERPVLVKVLTSSEPSARETAALWHERAILREIEVPGVVPVLALERQGTTAKALVFEDPGGRTLAEILSKRRPSIDEVIHIGTTLARTLEAVHARGLIHKDIGPHSILVDEATGAVQLMGFGLSSRMAREAPRAVSLENLEGTLAYMSPEQTGRMNRSVDRRTDLYSLGATLYEALTGAPPFSGDPAEIVHGHIARRPASPDEEDPRVPRALSRVVLRLLEKNAEDRYQSAAGLAADLEACARALAAGEEAEPFLLGRHDRPDTLRIPEKLYGRKAEEGALAAALERAQNGAAALAVVSGWAGIGKSALVHELEARVARTGGRFAAGKFDQYNRSAPLSAVAQALRDLVRQILGERSERLEAHRDRIMAALGPNGDLVTGLVPELSFVIGAQPPVPPLGGAEAQNRFFLALSSFLAAFTAPEQPLLLFLDDMQWADASSLKLLEAIFADKASSHLLVVGAHRDNEVDAAHPWPLTAAAIEGAGAPVTEIALGPLAQSDVADLVADALGASHEDALPLARVVFEQTQGNPFHTKQLLRALHDEGLVRFDVEAGAWRFDLDAVRARPAAPDVVDFMAARIAALPEDVREVLELGAAIGHAFDFHTLATLHGKQRAETASALWRALEQGLIVPEDIDELAVDTAATAPGMPLRYRFLHDRVQQAAYSLVGADRRATLHLGIGRLLCADKRPEQLADLTFDVARHLGLGAALITDPAERVRAAAVQLAAGRKARAAAAYEAALGHFRSGTELLPEGAWDDHYALALALHRDRAEAEVVTGNLAEAERIYPEALARARTALDKVSILSVQATHAQLDGRYADTIRAQREGLALLGWPLPDEEAILKALLDVKMAEIDAIVAARGVEAQLRAPKMKDPGQLAAMELAQGLFYAAYLGGDKTLAFLAVVEMVTASLEQGNGPLSPFAYIGYGMVAGLLGDHERGQRIARMGIELVDQFDNPAIKCLANYLYAADVHSWGRPLREVDPFYDRTYSYGLLSGDWITVGYMIMNGNCDRLTRGDALGDVLSRAQAHLVFLERAKNHTAIELLRAGVIQPIRALRGETVSPDSFDGGGFSEAGHLARYAGLDYHAAWLDYARIRHAFIMGDVARFASLWGQLDVIESAVPTHANKVPETNFYVALMRARVAGGLSVAEREPHLAEIRRIEGKLARWAKVAPDNVQHKLLLVRAELLRLEGRGFEAMDLYEAGIAAAHEARYVNNEAVGCELYARFWMAQGRSEIAALYLRKARAHYEAWGARAKAQALFEEHHELLAVSGEEAESEAPRPPPPRATVLPARPEPEGPDAFDLMTVLRASQAIAGEVVLGRVLERVARIVVESAGATSAAIILAREGELVLAARMCVDPDVVEAGSAAPIEDRADLPTSVITYVARTREIVEISGDAEDARFSADPYLIRQSPRSIFAVPLLHQGRLTGVLYLENRLTEAAFGRGRGELCELLAAQAAIAVENALLYADLEAMTSKLRVANERLERDVQDRTEALALANDRLVEELAERARTEAARASLQEEIIRMQEAKLAEMAAPLIPIASDVAVMPLIGAVDARRGAQVLETALRGATERGARALILDVTGMREIDAEAVRALVDTVSALRLVGAQAILTGVRADMAQKMIALGIDLSHIPIRSTLASGIDLARRPRAGAR
ncbi:AAA family ATPase [Polyangium aurulentum]|uniref:AAA family ATPase n=1 Tax=Polyangium aurulentum TaxID=2567896 RepID=UPI0010AE474F|nr:AAA family ATPase [Polyangium aurulentum]UQA55673.1 AAA family ATPase [Polyangium aurulentum]